MQETSKSVLKHHFLSSLGIAVLLHLLILVSFLNFNEKNPYLTTFNPANVYPVQIGPSGTKTTESSAVSSSRKRKREVLGSLTGVTSNALSDSNPKISADGTGQEMAANGTLVFDQAIQSYNPPSYPKIARMRGLEGDVLLRLKVSPEGIPYEPEIVKGSGYQVLDQAALDAVKLWRFKEHRSPDFALVEKRIIFKLNQ